MPTTQIWNNSFDCNELIATPPFSAEELREAGFPPESDAIIADANAFVLKKFRALPHYPKLSTFINDTIKSGLYALIRETPEDEEYRKKRYFLSFGVNLKNSSIEYPVSIQLALNNPNWESIIKKIGFTPGKFFVDFVESFPGLVFGHIEYPEFVLPSEFFTNVSEFLPEYSPGKIAIQNDKLSKLNNYLFFQRDYWGIYRFIGERDIVYELTASPFSFSSTNTHFEDWTSERVEKWNEPLLKPNT